MFWYIGNEKHHTISTYLKERLEKDSKNDDLKLIAENADQLINVLEEIKKHKDETK